MITNTYLSMEKDSVEHTPNMRKQFSTIPGIWIGGNMHWISNGHEKLISSESISIHVKEESIHSKVRLFQVYVRNHNEVEKNMKLVFMSRHHEVATEHLSFVSPLEKVIFHHSGEKMFLVNGRSEEGTIQQTVQPLWNIPTEQIWADQTKGILKYQPMGKGAAASIFTLDLTIPAQTFKKGTAWVIQGTEKNLLLHLNDTILKKHTSISK
ncbi:hypothetical protein DOE78_17170 [Bacillus sp. Y1]|nr:hypothetical protein [Bacillus sp. Y1]AYA77028.1 hypothetical protein DOE78_17170 [Bacillus sp. Y1]